LDFHRQITIGIFFHIQGILENRFALGSVVNGFVDFDFFTFFEQRHQFAAGFFVGYRKYIALDFFAFAWSSRKMLVDAFFDILAFANVNQIAFFIMDVINAGTCRHTFYDIQQFRW